MNKAVAPMGELDKELQLKMNLKFNPDTMNNARAWVEELTGEKFASGDQAGFLAHLKDGCVLGGVLNKVSPGAIKKVKHSTMAFVQREQICKYLDGCKKLGMRETDCFVTQDLFEGDNVMAVVDQILCLGALSQKVAGFSGPYPGGSVKMAEKNEREFSAEVIAAGKAIVPQVNSGSVVVDKGIKTDMINRYAFAGDKMGDCSAESTQQNSGSIAVDKGTKTDAIKKYAFAGDKMGDCSNESTQQNSGSIQHERQGNQDVLTRGMN